MNQREAFEKWAKKECCTSDKNGINFKRTKYKDGSELYEDASVETSWAAWQAAIAAQWQYANSAPYDEQVWISFVFPCGTKGQGYGIRVSDNDWFFDVSEDGDMISRSKSLKEGITCASVTHWMPLPPEPAK